MTVHPGRGDVEWTLCTAHADVHTLTPSLLIVVFIVTCTFI